MKIDLHCHTYPASSCSNMSIDDLVARAMEVGLDGVCLTEHNKPWKREDIQKLADETGLLIFRAMEVTTKDGDILVFGFHEEMDTVVTAAELRKRIDDVGGYMVAAHPFRGFLMFGFSELSLTSEKAAERPIFQAVHAIEAFNSKVSQQETDTAFEVAGRLHLPCVAGSDAHAVEAVGKFFTKFQEDISSEEELLSALVGGRFSIESLR